MKDFDGKSARRWLAKFRTAINWLGMANLIGSSQKGKELLEEAYRIADSIEELIEEIGRQGDEKRRGYHEN